MGRRLYAGTAGTMPEGNMRRTDRYRNGQQDEPASWAEEEAAWADTPQEEPVTGDTEIYTPQADPAAGDMETDMPQETPGEDFAWLQETGEAWQDAPDGGLEIDKGCMTNVENLFVAGEAVGGIHGRNRLMGNSLLDIIVFGRSAGKAAGAIAKETTVGALTLSHVTDFENELKNAGVETDMVSPKLLPDYRRTK